MWGCRNCAATVIGGDETRTVFAGIKAAYQPDELVGKLVIVAANLAPRKMSFGTSEGMIVASGPGGEQVWGQVDMGQETAFPAITGGIFEFGFSDAILQVWLKGRFIVDVYKGDGFS